MMQEIGRFNLGDMVSCFQPSTNRDRVIFGTLYGGIGKILPIIPSLSNLLFFFTQGVITKLSKELYEMLEELQNRMTKIIKPIGGIEHNFWRSFYPQHGQVEPAKGIIDGDLIELFLNLPAETMQQAVEGLQMDNGNGTKEDVSESDIIKLVKRFRKLL